MRYSVMGRRRDTGVSQSGVTIPNAHYLCRHFERHLAVIGCVVQPFQAAKLDALLAWAGIEFRSQTKQRRLLKRLQHSRAGNFYHNAWHIFGVVVAAVILSEAAHLDRQSRQTLLLLALTHDLDHRGRRVAPKQGTEEKRSATIALRLLCPVWSASGRWRHQFTQSIIATDPSCALESTNLDEITALLLDADIFASIFLPLKTALRLTRAVMREDTSVADTSVADTSVADTSVIGNPHHTPSSPLKTAAVFEAFLAYAARRGFKHQATRSLARLAQSRIPAVSAHPHHAKKLGFTPCR